MVPPRHEPGTLFRLTDGPAGTWAEGERRRQSIHLGAGLSGFAKVDVVWGDKIAGVGGQSGVRRKW